MQELFRSTTARYLLALAAVGIAVALRYLLNPLLGDRLPYSTFFLAVVVAAWIGGLGPALLATVVGSFASTLAFINDSEASPGSSEWFIRISVALIVGSAIAVLGGRMRREQLRAGEAAAHAVAQREELRTTLASIGDAVIVADAAGRVTLMNGVAESLTGWTAAEATGRPLNEVLVIVDEAKRTPVESPVERALRDGVVVGLANRTLLRSRDGSEHPIDDSAAPVRNADGRVQGVVLVFRDVANRRWQEKRARERSRQLQLVADNIPVLIAHCDRDQRFKFVNHPYARRFGMAPTDIIGKTIPELLGRDAAEVLAPHIQKVLTGERVQYEAEVPYKDGGAQFMRCAYEPEFDENGNVVGFVAAIFNITDRKRTEANLQATLNRLNLALDSARLGDWSWDVATDQVVLSPRAADVLGLPRDEPTTYQRFLELVPDDDRPSVRQSIQHAVAAGNRYQLEHRVDRPDGFQIWVSASGQTYYSPTGQPLGMYGVVQDITQRRAAEEGLRAESLVTETLYRIGAALAGQRNLHRIAQTVVDEATEVIGAEFGAFVYTVERERSGPERVCAFSGSTRRSPSQVSTEPNPAILESILRGGGVLRLDDLADDPRGERFPTEFQAWRSCLAVPVSSGSGEVLGGLVFGHTAVGVFNERHERLLVGVASQAAVAMDNARLYHRLHESDERFRQLAEHVTDVFWLRDCAAGRMLYVSPAFETIWERPREELLQNIQAFLDAVHPEDRGRVKEAFRRQDAGEQTTEEYRVVQSGGGLRWIWDRAFPVRTENGDVYRVAGIAEDVTDRKRAEDDARFLADASAALTSLVDIDSGLQRLAERAVPFFCDWMTIDLLDETGKLRRVAAAHVDPNKVELANEVNRRFPSDRNTTTGLWSVVNTGKPRFTPEITAETMEQSVNNAEFRAILTELGLRSYIGVPLTVRGKTFGVLSFITAESGRRYTLDDLAMAEDLARRTAVAVENSRLYQEVREADRRKEEFLGLLAHELRNPLAPVRNGLQILKLTGGKGPAAGDAVEMMERQIQHLIRLVDDLVDVSRVMRSQVELRCEPIPIAAVVERAVETSHPAVQAERHQFAVEIPSEPLWVNGDLVRLSQVVSNLINNAARYTPSGGSITVRVHREGDFAVLRVRDTGIGLSSDMLPKIWEMFVQADRTTKSAQVGMGIGLTLVKNLVEMHGGFVEAKSDGVGKGSEFIVRLPLVAAPPERKPSPPSPTSRHSSRRVLVVDDNVDVAQSLALLLDLEGHKTKIAHDGPTALKIALAEPPEIAFLDIGMPGMDGYELARKFREEEALRDVFLVALTGWGQAEDRRRTAEAGFDAHEVKPIEPEALAKVFSNWRTYAVQSNGR
jgi:PAS domain S-box-containing protein